MMWWVLRAHAAGGAMDVIAVLIYLFLVARGNSSQLARVPVMAFSSCKCVHMYMYLYMKPLKW